MNYLRTALFLLAFFLLLDASISPLSAKAQLEPRVSQVMIPFVFQAGDEKMPAGIYRFENRLSDFILLRGPDKKPVYVFVHDVISLGSHEAGTVVFRRYGKTYFLGQVWYNENTTGMECYKSRAEKNILRTSRKQSPNIITLALDSAR